MSYAMLPATVVLASVERYLAARETLLQQWADESIDRRVQESKPNRFTRLFGARQMTREEAVAEYKDSTERQFHRVHGGLWAQKAKGVQALARKAISSGVATVALQSDLALVLEKDGAL